MHLFPKCCGYILTHIQQSTGLHAAQTINSTDKYIIIYMSIHEHPVTPNNRSCKLSQNPIHPIWWTLTIVEISLPQRHAKPDNVRNEKPITTVNVSRYCGFRRWPRFRTLVVALSEASCPIYAASVPWQSTVASHSSKSNYRTKTTPACHSRSVCRQCREVVTRTLGHILKIKCTEMAIVDIDIDIVTAALSGLQDTTVTYIISTCSR